MVIYQLPPPLDPPPKPLEPLLNPPPVALFAVSIILLLIHNMLSKTSLQCFKKKFSLLI